MFAFVIYLHDICQEKMHVPNMLIRIASHDWHWLRQTLCTTLGQMFKVLGKEHTAFDIYQFYMSRQIVVRKVEDAERKPD